MKINKIIITVTAAVLVFTYSLSAQSNSKNNSNSLIFSTKTDFQNITSENINNTTLTPSPQLAMSTSDYPVTAGDIYTLAFNANATPVTYTIPVDTTYKIRVANMGILDVRGLNYLQLKKQVEDIVTRNYPMSGVQFVLLTPAVFSVTIKGEVKQTEIRKAWALSRLSSVIEDTFTDYSSERNILVTSANGVKNTYDLFKAERYGDISQDPYIRPGDTITVNRTKRKVTISGAVERPGEYELLDNEQLKELVEYYGGGLSIFADESRIEITRYFNKEDNDDFDASGEMFYYSGAALTENLALFNHDVVEIANVLELKPVMFIEGAVYSDNAVSPNASNRVSVQFTTNENYAFLVRRNRTMFSTVSDISNAYIIRNNQIIPIDLSMAMYDKSYYCETDVQPNDVLMIPFKQYFVTVAGAVNAPGRYPYIPDRDWEYYIALAGGFITTSNAHEAVTIIDVNGLKHSKKDPITPETVITAKSNSFTFYFNQYSGVITTVLSLAATIIAIMAAL